MSCFYCGKRVSLVRKRSDADFCCDDHREKYHARTLRTIETLREADEQIAVTRRLNEGMPLRPSVPLRGTRSGVAAAEGPRIAVAVRVGAHGPAGVAADSGDSRSRGHPICFPQRTA